MRIIAIDLAVRGGHKAIIADERGQAVSRVLSLATRAAELDALLAQARKGAEGQEIWVVMEPTGMAWFPVAVYLERHGAQCFLVNSQQVADLRRYYKRHAKSDRIDVRVLARLPLVSPEKLHRLLLPSAMVLAVQRGCRELDRLSTEITKIHNRVQATDRFAWPGLEELVFPDLLSPAARWFHTHWYNPVRVCQAGSAELRAQWLASGEDTQDDGEWVEALCRLAQEVLRLYGSEGQYVNFELLQAEMQRELEHLRWLEQVQHRLKVKTVRRLYRRLHPRRLLETMKGVGQDSAAVYVSFIGEVTRFATRRCFRGWSGMVPNSKQSADSEAKGLSITKAGPRLIKKYAYLDANVARRFDPQIAAIYYDQVMRKGKHHNQALCACATHLLDRVRAVLLTGQPYQLRDVNGTPVTREQAQKIIAERYTVPETVRKRNNKHGRRMRAERRGKEK
ncbi:MAG: IS110 family transposase [Chloroflexi bacterium]|nr:IS110 family transposase [Chloroflexota bacterium]